MTCRVANGQTLFQKQIASSSGLRFFRFFSQTKTEILYLQGKFSAELLAVMFGDASTLSLLLVNLKGGLAENEYFLQYIVVRLRYTPSDSGTRKLAVCKANKPAVQQNVL